MMPVRALTRTRHNPVSAWHFHSGSRCRSAREWSASAHRGLPYLITRY